MSTIDAVGRKEQIFEDMLNDYDNAKTWLESVGVKIDSGRFQSYKKLIAQKIKHGTFNSPDINDSDTLWAIAELHDLLDIYEYLHGFDHHLIQKTLRWLKKGSDFLLDEPKDGGGIHGRNYTFELYTASRLLRAGLDVSYQSKADINISLLNTLIHVECKRAVSENNLEALIEKAIYQIDRSCKEAPSDRGLIVLSLSKLFWKVQEELNQGNVADESELQSLLAPVSQTIAEGISAKYSNKSKNVIGLIFHYKVPFYRRTNGFPAFINRFSFVPFPAPGSVNKSISDKLSEHFKQSMYRSG
jgi:hypothetical protein